MIDLNIFTNPKGIVDQEENSRHNVGHQFLCAETDSQSDDTRTGKRIDLARQEGYMEFACYAEALVAATADGIPDVMRAWGYTSFAEFNGVDDGFSIDFPATRSNVTAIGSNRPMLRLYLNVHVLFLV